VLELIVEDMRGEEVLLEELMESIIQGGRRK
jgi:hypothetical protein